MSRQIQIRAFSWKIQLDCCVYALFSITQHVSTEGAGYSTFKVFILKISVLVVLVIGNTGNSKCSLTPNQKLLEQLMPLSRSAVTLVTQTLQFL